MLTPLKSILDRAERGRADSDTTLFLDLLYAGEAALKLTVAAFVSAIQDDRERHRYRLIHRLVRADGLGDWSQALDDTLTGPASQHMFATAKDDRRALTERLGPGSWQYEAVSLLQDTLRRVAPGLEPTSSRVALRNWFFHFPELRNKTRAHGAPTSTLCAAASPDLERSIRLICENNPLFQRQWAYLHRNLSGKYRVVPLGSGTASFDHLKVRSNVTSGSPNFSDGVYVYFDEPCRVELIDTTVDVSDFYFPNGAFSERKFELHSLITDSRKDGDATPYLSPAGERPTSETQGMGHLDVIGNVWSNLPKAPADYVPRPTLEQELLSSIMNDRHPITTLVGRGGIGKTSLALTALHAAANQSRFDAILWFSARDIDLLSTGPKVVQPHVLTENDMADEFVKLLDPPEARNKGFRPTAYLAECMSRSKLGGPILFVFDNFETVRSPVDLFNWIDTNIRLPNKALITSRFRDFKADFPIEIQGMERSEADQLIEKTATSLGVTGSISDAYREDIYDESDGHPYIIKIIIGEIADSNRCGKPERIVARKDEILDALFERTYANLSPAAKRIFLTLCGWRSLVPQLALEAVLLGACNERIDSSRAVDELLRMSLVQRTVAVDGTDFLDVPLVATVFGQRKLSVSPIQASIESDIRMLQDIGPTSESTLKAGIAPRIQSLFEKTARRISDGGTTIEEMRPVLELVSRSYSPGWLLMADLYEESGDASTLALSPECIRRFLETNPDSENASKAWGRLAVVYQRLGDVRGACDAHIRALSFPGAAFSSISNIANWFNQQRSELNQMDLAERNRLFRGMIRLMETRLREASASDLSRLAWLHLHVGDVQRAQQLTSIGLEKEPDNIYCQKLAARLQEA
jgi:hypothetical protein